MTYLFQNATAFDPYTGEGVPNATGQVFALSDTAFATPLTVILLSSGLQSTELVSDQYSQLPGFDAGDNLQVVFKSGEFTKLLNTSTPLPGPVGPSAYGVAVENGYTGTEAEYNATLADAGSLVTRAETAEQAAIDAAGLVGAPAGSAVLAAISEGGAARTELTAAIGEQNAAQVPPLVAEAIASDGAPAAAAAAAVSDAVAGLSLAEASYTDDVPGIAGGLIDPAGNIILGYDYAGQFTPDTAQRLGDSMGAAQLEEVPEAPSGWGVVDPDGNTVRILGEDWLLDGRLLTGIKDYLTPALTVRKPTNFVALPATSNATMLAGIMNRANKYMLNTWIPATYPGTGKITFAWWDETNIRTPSSAVLGLASTLATGTHDATATGVTEVAARAACVRLVISLAAQHVSNGGNWGGTANTPPNVDSTQKGWQEALWAYMSGTAGWLVWDSLDEATQANVARMVIHEADRMLTWKLPYWKDLTGTVITPGDSKEEEISWDASVVALAVNMFPKHDHAREWLVKLCEMGVGSTAMQSDLASPVPVNGFTPADIMDGWNVNDNGTIDNHFRIHPDYMVSAFGSLWGALFAFGATGMDAPAALSHHAKEIYGALSTVVFSAPPFDAPGGTIYKPDGTLYYPQGNDWGTHRIMDKALADVIAAKQGWDAGLPTSADEWATMHLTTQVGYQARGSSGQTYYAPAEDTFTGREQWVSHHAGIGLLAICTPVPHQSNATPDTIHSRNKAV